MAAIAAPVAICGTRAALPARRAAVVARASKQVRVDTPRRRCPGEMGDRAPPSRIFLRFTAATRAASPVAPYRGESASGTDL